MVLALANVPSSAEARTTGFPGSVTARCCQAQEASLQAQGKCEVPLGAREEHISVFKAMGASIEQVAPARSLSVRDCRLPETRLNRAAGLCQDHTRVQNTELYL